tara:strand:- start:110 stop:274 length:165 start_codon:yes stop_codon:yes gene_type:complete
MGLVKNQQSSLTKIDQAEQKMAERAGFEPAVGGYPYGGLANRWFQPLTHLSASQ